MLIFSYLYKKLSFSCSCIIINTVHFFSIKDFSQLVCKEINDCTNVHEFTLGLHTADCTVYSQANHSRLTALPRALFHSRQMEGNITTACTIAFIKHTKGVLTVSYFLRKGKLSRKRELYSLCIHLKTRNIFILICWRSAGAVEHL